MIAVTAAAATDKPKATKRSAKVKYSRDELEAMGVGELRKQVTSLIPSDKRNGIKPNFAKKDELIDLLMNYKA